MEHHHHHHHHHAPAGNPGGIFVFSIVLNLAFVAVEAVVGLVEGSLSLLSDAGHNLGDVFSLVLVLVAFRLARVHSTKRFTYGLKKSTVLISLLNAILLLVAVGAIAVEAARKLAEPTPVDGAAVTWTALVGIAVNGLTALLLMRGQKSDINVRGAFLHMAADTLVSAGVVVSGLAITFTGLDIIDPIVSLAVAAVILVSTWRLLSESLRLSLDGTPEGVDVDDITRLMASLPHVSDVHHVHLWAISTTSNALTAHVVVDEASQMDTVRAAMKRKLSEAGIAHSTLEMETPASHCPDHDCVCDGEEAHHHH